MLFLGPASASEKDPVSAELLSSMERVSRGESFSAGIRIEMEAGWHTYWLNPGDSGASPEFSWNMQDGVRIGEIQFPVPDRIPYGELVNFGYSNEVIWPFKVNLDESFLSDFVRLSGRLEILICSDICIPKALFIDLVVPVGKTKKNEKVYDLLDRSFADLPLPLNVRPVLRVLDDSLDLRFGYSNTQMSRLEDVYFYPLKSGLIENTDSQSFSFKGNMVSLKMKRADQFQMENPIKGLLVVNENTYQIDIEKPSMGDGKKEQEELGLLFAILLALAGGIILNLMPCVFPVLSIKILSFLDRSESGSRGLVAHGWAYGLGVVFSFIVLGLLVSFFRAGGESVGWGFQLQSPIIVSMLVYVFMLVGFNLLGFFEINFSFSLRKKNDGLSGAFLSGVLATAVASPCTAPFMGAALGYAILQAPSIGVVVFASLGLGMALPFVLLCYFPGWVARMPKPGPWMINLKQFLAFPMFASAIWLIWVLQFQEKDFFIPVLLGILFISMALWISRLGQTRLKKTMVVFFFGLALALAFSPLLFKDQVNDGKLTSGIPEHSRYSKGQLERAIKQGPVFVNFTAAWCVTCKVNEIGALNSKRIADAFNEKELTYMVADWTNEDPQITEALQRYGRAGVPLYLLFAKNSLSPFVLPQILTIDILLSALDKI